MKLRILASLSVLLLVGCITSESSENGETAEFLDNRLVRDVNGCAFLVIQSNDSQRVYMKFVTESSSPECRFLYKNPGNGIIVTSTR